MVEYCSYCREDRGRHTLRGSHSSSHDSRRRYLSDAYLEKIPILEERALTGVDINVGIAINAKGGYCWIMLSLMPMV
jgi:hypothetical protein